MKTIFRQRFFAHQAFTIAELLISLAILALIATFSIPKILAAQHNEQYKAEAREVMGALTNALENCLQSGASVPTLTSLQVIQAVNYVKRDTTSQIQDVDNTGNMTVVDCSDPKSYCLLLHNGGVLYVDGGSNTNFFGASDDHRAIWFNFDPDGSGPTVDVSLVVYSTGRVTSESNMLSNTVSCWTWGCGTFNPQVNSDPSWFNWN